MADGTGAQGPVMVIEGLIRVTANNLSRRSTGPAYEGVKSLYYEPCSSTKGLELLRFPTLVCLASTCLGNTCLSQVHSVSEARRVAPQVGLGKHDRPSFQIPVPMSPTGGVGRPSPDFNTPHQAPLHTIETFLVTETSM